MTKLSFAFAAFNIALLVAGLATPSLAQERWDHGDPRRYHGYDFDHWRRGNWFHGFHDGRMGWWWIVNGEWFFYPAPIYPYPDPFAPVVAAPPPVVAAPPPAVVAPPAPGQYWYYCANPPGYYPNVPQCTVPWTLVSPRP